MPQPTSLETLYAHFLAAGAVSTDTRKLPAGALFFALKGPNFNGNQFLQQALDAGASAVVYDDAQLAGNERWLYVENSLQALQALATHHRRRLSLPVIGITGSNGKTTTKELLRCLLHPQHRAYVTEGNLNNHIGVPLSLLRLTADHTLAVLELGDNHPGEIALLAELAAPTHGLITNLGEDHLEGYGSMEANAATKLELFDYLNHRGGHCFINRADPWLATYRATSYTDYNTPASGYHVVRTTPSPTGTTMKLTSPSTGTTTYRTRLIGSFHAENLLAAVVIAEHFGCTPAAIQQGLNVFQPAANRGQLVQAGGKTFLLDAYNANPSSMQLAVSEVLGLPGVAPGLLLGDMLELGSYAEVAHRAIGEKLATLPQTPVVFIGPLMQHAQRALGRGAWYPDRTTAAPHLKEDLTGADFILVKASRGLALEKLLEVFC